MLIHMLYSSFVNKGATCYLPQPKIVKENQIYINAVLFVCMDSQIHSIKGHLVNCMADNQVVNMTQLGNAGLIHRLYCWPNL